MKIADVISYFKELEAKLAELMQKVNEQ